MGQVFTLRDVVDCAKGILGPAFITLPVGARFLPSPTKISMLTEIQEQADESREHRAASLRDILCQGHVVESPFTVLIDYQVLTDPPPALDQVSVAIHRLDGSFASLQDSMVSLPYGLNVECRQSDDRIEVYVMTQAGQFSKREVERLLISLDELFNDVVESVTAAVDVISGELNPSPAVGKTKSVQPCFSVDGASSPNGSHSSICSTCSATKNILAD